MAKSADPRATRFPLMEHPMFTFGMVAIYLSWVLVIGQTKDLGHELEVLAEQILQLICQGNVNLIKKTEKIVFFLSN